MFVLFRLNFVVPLLPELERHLQQQRMKLLMLLLPLRMAQLTIV